jgi:hypothetical protein
VPGSAPGTPDPPDRWLETSLEEYRSLREEALGSLQSHLATLRYGLAGIVVLLGFALRYASKGYLGWLLALVIDPVVVIFIAIMWMGEYERMARAGYFLARLESRINKHLRKRALEWEHWLRERGPDFSRQAGSRHRYTFIFLIFIVMECVTLAIGVYALSHQLVLAHARLSPSGLAHAHARLMLRTKHVHTGAYAWLPVLVFANVGVMVALASYFRSSYERLREYAKTPASADHPVRRRVRIRVWLVVSFVSVAVVAVPLPVYGLSVALFVLLPERVEYLGFLPAVAWAAAIPLIAPSSIVRPLLKRWLLDARAPTHREREVIEASLGLTHGALGLEREDLQEELDAIESAAKEGAVQTLAIDAETLLGLQVYETQAPNAPSPCRDGVTVTSWACEDQGRLVPLLAHELAHHRLRHLRVLALMHVYLWPYRYFSIYVPFYGRRSWSERPSAMLRRIAAPVGWLLELPGWLAWSTIRITGRALQRDADRYVDAGGLGLRLEGALDEAAPEPPRDWFGLPIPAEHADPRKRRTWSSRRREREDTARKAK